MLRWCLFVFVTAILLTQPQAAVAQFNLGGLDFDGSNPFEALGGLPGVGTGNGVVGGLDGSLFSNEPQLRATPSYPEPFSEFTIDLEAPSTANQSVGIRWIVEGEEQVEYRNKRSLELTAPALGETITIEAELEHSDGTIETVRRDITAIQIDIIVEGLTLVPAFYQGRPLPSHGSIARASAVLNNGTLLNRSNLSYRWEVDGNVLESGSVKGLMGVNFPMSYNQETYVSVTIFDGANILGEKGISIRPAVPEIEFYERNPLRGIQTLALGTETTISGNQLTVRAEPYHATPFTGVDPEVYLTAWSVNNRPVDNSGAREINEIIIRSDGGNSSARLAFQMVDFRVLPRQVADQLQVTFGQ